MYYGICKLLWQVPGSKGAPKKTFFKSTNRVCVCYAFAQAMQWLALSNSASVH